MPDMLNLAKQVTNGAQPLGAVVARKEIYETFMEAGGPEYMLEFAHGYTYSAHPVACAAGIAALDLLVGERAVERVARARAVLRERRARPQGAASTSTTSVTSGSPPASRSTACPASPRSGRSRSRCSCLEKGVYVRYGGDTIQLAPPFISEKAEIDRLVSVLADALAATA